MKIYNNYILTIAILFLLTTIILVAMGQNSLDVYYTAYIIEALVVTQIHVYFNDRVRRRLNFVSIMLFVGFLFIVALQTIKILA